MLFGYNSIYDEIERAQSIKKGIRLRFLSKDDWNGYSSRNATKPITLETNLLAIKPLFQSY